MNKSVASNNSDMYVCKCINERVCKGDWEKRSGHAIGQTRNRPGRCYVQYRLFGEGKKKHENNTY